MTAKNQPSGGVEEDDPTALNSLSKFTLFETKRYALMPGLIVTFS
jgi:hypothetical protein